MNRPRNPNLQILALAIDQLGDLADEMVLLGGCATGNSGDSKLNYPGFGFGPGRLGARVSPVKASSLWINSPESY
jgi:hypothetical protein